MKSKAETALFVPHVIFVTARSALELTVEGHSIVKVYSVQNVSCALFVFFAQPDRSFCVCSPVLPFVGRVPLLSCSLHP